MNVGGVMACAHDDAPLSKRISLMFPPAVPKCTLSLPIFPEGRSLETLPVVTGGPESYTARIGLRVTSGAYPTPTRLGIWTLGIWEFLVPVRGFEPRSRG